MRTYSLLLLTLIGLAFWSCEESHILNYEIRLSEDNSEDTPFIILMHGKGGNAKSYSQKGVFNNGISVIYLDAPYSMNPSSNGNKWYDFMREIGDGWSGNQNQIKESIELVLNTIKKVLKEKKIKSNHIFIGGHSQGGIIAYKIALTYPEIFKGFIISSGRLPVEYAVKNDLSHYQNKKVLIIHGKNDGAIELKYSLAGKNLMEKLGMETQYVIKDRGHGQAPDFYEIVESWLK
jgi:phospholipase/carboxylesterase